MDPILKFIAIVGAIDTLILIYVVVRAVYLWARGISPALSRLGNGLARRKIAIFAKGDNLSSLTSLLADSQLFPAKNIYGITNAGDVGKAEGATVYLVYWHDWIDNIDDILRQKPDRCALVVYAPYNLGRIADNQMEKLDGKRHTAVTNFRGRLLNDIVTSMITTSYKQ